MSIKASEISDLIKARIEKFEAGAEARNVGNAIARQEAKGVCCHQGVVGYLAEPVYPEQIGLSPGQVRCTDGCGAVFASEDDWFAAMGYALDF